MNNLINQLARWIAPGDARGALNTFASGIDFLVEVPLGTHGVRLSLHMQKRPDELFQVPALEECPMALAQLLLSRLGSPPLGNRMEGETTDPDSLTVVVCGECGASNHTSSLLCRRCGNRLLDAVDRSHVTAEEVMVLLNLLVARTQAETGDAQRGFEVLESQLATLPPHQVMLHEMGIYLAFLGRFHDAACYVWVASLVEPWLSLTRPRNLHVLVKRLLELHVLKAPAADAASLPLEFPKLDETRMRVALGALRRALQQEAG